MVATSDRGSGGSPRIVTDYSCYSLDDIWASVNQTDWQTWPQIDAWKTMAGVCAEQAGQLKLALSQLMRRWVPTSGSAAEAFAATVNNLIAAMQRDATAATNMQPVLVQIMEALSDTKDKVQTVIDQRDHYQAVEQAHLANPMAMRFAPVTSPLPALMTESAPDNWRQDLRTQAVAIMAAGDATIGAITAHMPTLSEATFAALEPLTRVGPPPPTSGTIDDLHDARGGFSNAVVAPMLSARSLGSPTSRSDRDEPAGTPTLAGRVSALEPVGIGIQPVPSPISTFTHAPSGRPTRYGPGVGVFVPPFGPGDTVEPAISAPAQAPSEAGNVVQQTRAGNPMLLPPGSQTRQSSGQGQMRRAGRAALWASQRQRRSPKGESDPWAVAQGIPAVIEPIDTVDHDPGPGVIGIDR